MTQRLILVRHGEAVSETVDPQRPLSDAGRQAVQRVATWVASAGLTADEAWHSGKLRAAQTAELIVDAMMPHPPLKAVSGLAPNDDIEPIADSLLDGPDRLMLVGHLPFLGRLVSRLVIGSADRPLADFAAGTLVLLDRIEERWVIRCVIPPDLLP
ncbi:MAG: phosphohistidine phosphatase SixA [Planctomycetes bacterium]|nr:phosphohistidine phosphatase SixA [Planctomycetota bacterium]